MKALFDTNILIDYLNGMEQAREELALYDDPVISIITWMEVRIGAQSDDEQDVLQGFLNRFRVIPLTAEVAEKSIELRQQHRMRLPDAIIWGTALAESCLLVSRNTRDFPADHPGVRAPYKL